MNYNYCHEISEIYCNNCGADQFNIDDNYCNICMSDNSLYFICEMCLDMYEVFDNLNICQIYDDSAFIIQQFFKKILYSKCNIIYKNK